MRIRLGKFLIVLGAVLLVAALTLFVYNKKEALEAASASETAVVAVRDEIISRLESEQEVNYSNPYANADETEDQSDAEAEPFYIDGYRYIGYITLPTLGIELPVMYDWSYPQLKLSPCRYTGSASTHDLCIMAHNYSRHFGRIRELVPGDEVCYVDMDGTVYTYEVILQENLEPTAVAQMTSGGYDLTLFTCTYGGQTRVTVRCSMVEDLELDED